MNIADQLEALFEDDFESMAMAVMATSDAETVKLMCRAFYHVGGRRVAELHAGAATDPLKEYKHE